MKPKSQTPSVCVPNGKAIGVACQHKQRISFSFTAVSLVFLICVTGCSSPPLKPIPEEQRYAIRMSPFNDLTGAYEKLSQPLEVLASSVLNYDFIEIIIPGSQSPYEPPKIKTYPNPFKLVSSGSLSSNAGFVISGEVERISYEPIVNIKKAITIYHFFGLLPLWFSDDDEGIGAYVQYRIRINDIAGTPIDSFVVVGASSGDIEKVGREQMIGRANVSAAYHLRIQLLDRLVLNRGLKLPYKLENSTREKIKRIKNLMPSS